jgi:hypothetical protein
MADTPNPYRLAHDGYGWNDIVVRCKISEAEARLIVFGRHLYMNWKARQEAKAS